MSVTYKSKDLRYYLDICEKALNESIRKAEAEGDTEGQKHKKAWLDFVEDLQLRVGYSYEIKIIDSTSQALTELMNSYNVIQRNTPIIRRK